MNINVESSHILLRKIKKVHGGRVTKKNFLRSIVKALLLYLETRTSRKERKLFVFPTLRVNSLQKSVKFTRECKLG